MSLWERIQALHFEAGSAGDFMMAAICDRALSRDSHTCLLWNLTAVERDRLESLSADQATALCLAALL